MKKQYFILVCSFGLFFQGCKQTGESRNPAEIVSREADTVFNEIPGKQHLGKDVFEYNIVETLQDVRKTNAFLEGLKKTGYLDTLQSDGPFTVFAPRDEAFPGWTKDTTSNDNDEAPKMEFTADMIRSYIVRGLYKTEALSAGSITVNNLNGTPLKLSFEGDKLMVNDNIMVFKKDINTKNGVIHEITKLIKN